VAADSTSHRLSVMTETYDRVERESRRR
jgi:hypothetical protein